MAPVGPHLPLTVRVKPYHYKQFILSFISFFSLILLNQASSIVQFVYNMYMYIYIVILILRYLPKCIELLKSRSKVVNLYTKVSDNMNLETKFNCYI